MATVLWLFVLLLVVVAAWAHFRGNLGPALNELAK